MKNIKDIVFYKDPILGDYTIQDLIWFLENQYIKSKKFDIELSKLLKRKGISNTEISRLLLIADHTYNLKFILDMLNGHL